MLLLKTHHLVPLLLSLTVGFTSASPAPQKRTTTLDNGAQVNGKTYDYIVVGGGLAGSVLAKRLTEGQAGRTVLVVEAGEDREGDERVYDASRYQSAFDTELDYAFQTTPQPSSGSSSEAKTIRAGKMLGGSTGINGLAWSKPHDFQIDALAAVGNEGLNWDVLQEYMKKAEGFQPPSNGYQFDASCHGSGGPIGVQFDASSSPNDLERSFSQTLDNLGLPDARGKDLTCGDPAGSAQISNTKSGNTRITAYRGYLRGQDIDNLTILTKAQVGKVLLSEGSSPTATGIEFRDNAGTTYTAKANLEVIMAAGSIMSPVILQHSGIGPNSVLSSASVGSRVDLPVGMNLVDQVTTTTNWQFSGNRGGAQEILFPRFQDMLEGADADRLRGILENDLDAYAQDAVNNGAATNATALRMVLEMQRDWILNQDAGIAESFDYSYGTTLGYDSWFLLPFGRGSVKITNSDAYAPPATGVSIDPRYLSNDFDRLAQGAITRYTREVTYASPLNGKITSEGTPGYDVGDLNAWADWSESNYRSNWHPIGTIAMMSQDMGGCVDSNYQVYGVGNLRVVDASILPFQVSSHLMSVLYGLAERAAEIILAANPGNSDGGNGGGNTPEPEPQPTDGRQIHPNGDNSKCLTVAGQPTDGSAVVISDCVSNGAGQRWNVQRGSTSVQLAGTNFCVDAGSNPSNGVKGKIWTCYSGLAAQRWWLTDAGDDHLAVQDQGQCLDLPDGNKSNGNVVQTWACDGGNPNQKWTLSA